MTSNPERFPTDYPGITRLGSKTANHFQVRVQAGRDPISGRYKEVIKTFHGTLSEARSYQVDLKTEVRTQVVTSSNCTLNQLVERYLEHAEETLSPNTVKKYRSDFEGKIKNNSIGHRKARSITIEDWDAFFQATKRARNIKGKTVNRLRAMLKSAYRQGVIWKWVPTNPIDGTTAFHTEEYDGELVELEVIELLLKAYTNTHPRMGMLLRLSMLNSLRRAEACGLQIGDYDAANETLKITRVVNEPKGGGYTITPWSKNKKIGKIDLDPMSIEMLEELIGDRTDPGAFIFSDDGGKTPWLPGRVTQSQANFRDRLCPQCGTLAKMVNTRYDLKEPKQNKDGKWRRYGYRQAPEPNCHECGTKVGVYFRVHDLRAFTTTALIDAGESKAAQQRGRWKDETAMRRHYMKYTKTARNQAVATITEIFGRGA